MSLSNSLRAAALRLGLVVPAVIAVPLDPSAARAAEPVTLAAQAGTSIAAELVTAFDRVFKGPYAGARAIHAKGIVLRGSFIATPDAGSLSSAEHLRPGVAPVPVIVRFSNFSGVPAQIDGKPGTNPTGMAIKFQLRDGIDTDIVAHSYNGFPVATPEAFLEYLNALSTGDTQTRDAFLAGHSAARRFLDTPKPIPVSYATEAYFGVNAFRFFNAAGTSRFARYRIEPLDGTRYLGGAEAADIKADYLRDELRRRVTSAPVRFRLVVQLSGSGDAVADPSIAWPADRPEIVLGTLSLDRIVEDNDPELRTLFFSPMNLVPGIAASADPLLAARTRSYAISYRRRVATE
jgi:catalase